MGDCHGCAAATIARPPVQSRRHIVAIVGPPNSGKSTLFNRLTGLRQKVANFPGVTVEHRMGRVKLEAGREIYVVDLPGVYSLSPRTEDERVTHDVLCGTMKGLPRPDAVLLILDSTNLSRHLILAAPVLSLGLPTLVILNMADDLERRGGDIDSAELAMQLGSPVALVSAAKGSGVDKVFQFLSGTTLGAAAKPPLHRAARYTGHSQVPRRGCERRHKNELPGAGAAALDAAPRRPLPASNCRTSGISAGGDRGVPDDFQGRAADHGCGADGDSIVGPVVRVDAAGFRAAVAGGRRNLERCGVGGRLPAADSAAVPVHRDLRRLGLSCTRRADRGSHHGALRPSGQELHSTALGLCLRGAGDHGHAYH